MSEQSPEPSAPAPVEASTPVTIEPVEPVETVAPVTPVASGASNESPTLPPSAAVAAAKAHAALGHLVTVAQQVQADLERYIPQSLLSQAEIEVSTLIRGIL